MEEINKIVVDGETWYKVKDIGIALKIKNINESIPNIPQSMLSKFKTKTKGGAQLCNFVNVDGFKRLLISSRSTDITSIYGYWQKWQCY